MVLYYKAETTQVFGLSTPHLLPRSPCPSPMYTSWLGWAERLFGFELAFDNSYPPA